MIRSCHGSIISAGWGRLAFIGDVGRGAAAGTKGHCGTSMQPGFQMAVGRRGGRGREGENVRDSMASKSGRLPLSDSW